MSEGKSRRDLIIASLVILYFVAVALVCLRGVIFSEGVISGYDCSMPPEQDQVIKAFESYRYVWFHIQNLAGSEQLQVQKAMINFYAPSYLLACLGFSGATLSKLFLLFLLAASGLSSYVLLRFLKIGRISSLMAATVYMLSPVVFNLVVLEGAGIEVVVYAVLPLTFYFFLRSVSGKTWLMYSILTVLTLLFSPKILVTGVILLVFYSAFRILASANKKGSLKSHLRSLTVIIVLYVPLQAYWSITILLHPLQASGGVPFHLGTTTAVPVSDFMRLVGFWAPFFESSVLSNNTPLILVSFCIPLLAFGSLLVSRRDVNAVFFAIFAVILIAVATSSTFASLIAANSLSFLGYFRDFTTLYTLLAFSYLVLIGVAIDRVCEWGGGLTACSGKAIRGNVKPIVAVGLIAVLTAAYASPFLSGDLKGTMKTLDFPSEYNDASNWVGAQGNASKVLWLPTGSGYVQEIGSEIPWHSDYYSFFSPVPGGFHDVNYRYMFVSEHWLEDLLYENKTNSLGSILGLYGIKYVIVRTDTEITQWATVLSEDLDERRTSMILSNLEEQEDLTLVDQLGNICIFENQHPLPAVYAADSASVVAGDLSSMLALVNSGFDFRSQALIFASQQDRLQIIELAETILAQRDDQLIDLAVTDLPRECVIDPGSCVQTKEANGEWSDLHHVYWWYDVDYQAALEHCAFTKGNAATLEVPFRVAEPGKHVIWVKAYRGDRNGKVVFQLEDVVDEIDMYSETGEGYVWEKLGVFELDKGLNTLYMTSDCENVVARLVIATESQFDNAVSEVARLQGSREVTSPSQSSLETLDAHQSGGAAEIEFVRLDPTKYKVEVRAGSPFVLVLSESYDKGWKAYVNSQGGDTNWIEAFFQESIGSASHFEVNGYANAWYVDPAELGVGEEFSMTLYYKPQSLFYLGLVISGLTFVACVGLLVWSWKRGRNPEARGSVRRDREDEH